MTERNSRLEEIRQDLGLNKTEMASVMGITPHYYYGILSDNGKANLRIEHLEALLKDANANPMWILTGQGDKYVGISDKINAQGDPTPEQIEALYQYVISRNTAVLTPHQDILLRLACSQCYIDYPDINSLRDLAIAASVYLKIIIRYPKADFVAMLGIQ